VLKFFQFIPFILAANVFLVLTCRALGGSNTYFEKKNVVAVTM
jgi:hypothetical protein